MYQTFEMELAGRTLKVDIGRVGKQANGCAFMHYGDTVVLSTATASEKPRDGIDFFPLSVEYEEKMYAVGKIPGGFNKREGKASENAILTSRVIDRPMRPLFPKDYRNDVTLNNMVMSVDPACRPELVAMLGAAIATCISDIPFDGPCAMTQMGLVNGMFVVNPSQEEWKNGDLNLTVASTREKVIMIEAGANEVPEAKMIEAIYKAHEINQTIIAFIDKIVAETGKPKHTYTSCAIPEEMFEEIRRLVPPEEMEVAVFTDDKQIREENIRNITAKLEEAFAEKEDGEQNDENRRGKLEHNGISGGGQLVGDGKKDVGAADGQRPHQHPQVHFGPVAGQFKVQSDHHQSDGGAPPVDGHAAPGDHLDAQSPDAVQHSGQEHAQRSSLTR